MRHPARWNMPPTSPSLSFSQSSLGLASVLQEPCLPVSSLVGDFLRPGVWCKPFWCPSPINQTPLHPHICDGEATPTTQETVRSLTTYHGNWTGRPGRCISTPCLVKVPGDAPDPESASPASASPAWIRPKQSETKITQSSTSNRSTTRSPPRCKCRRPGIPRIDTLSGPAHQVSGYDSRLQPPGPPPCCCTTTKREARGVEACAKTD